MAACVIVIEELRVLDEEQLRGCGDVCPFDAIRVMPGRVLVDAGRCAACLACMALCRGAVEVVTGWRCG
ncbi:MAG: hypothetical protein GXO15_00995 [Crenarchaeota archaeon]|nr:hypothetical protein [Thermoproteota archaeon]